METEGSKEGRGPNPMGPWRAVASLPLSFCVKWTVAEFSFV